MSPEKEKLFKQAQHLQSNMTRSDRLALADEAIYIRNWFNTRMLDAILNPPSGVIFTDELGAWLDRDDIRSYESDLFRRLAIGYSMLVDDWVGGEVLRIELDESLLALLESSLMMRRSVMDSDVRMIKEAFWMQDIKRSTLLKEITRIITKGDYVAAKRWIDESLKPQPWYCEFTPKGDGRRGRKGVMCRIGPLTDPRQVAQKWGVEQ